MIHLEITAAELNTLALEWLKSFDKMDFSRCWQDASPELKKQVDEQDFVTIMSGKRSHQGIIVSRELIDAGAEMTYHKRPDIVHRVLRYEATLQAGSKSQELVTFVKSEDATWQVANYTVL